MDKRVIDMAHVRQLEADKFALIEELTELKKLYSKSELNIDEESESNYKIRLVKLQVKVLALGISVPVWLVTSEYRKTYYSGVTEEVARYLFKKQFPNINIISVSSIDLGNLQSI